MRASCLPSHGYSYFNSVDIIHVIRIADGSFEEHTSTLVAIKQEEVAVRLVLALCVYVCVCNE
jgi:hypothetical protein